METSTSESLSTRSQMVRRLDLILLHLQNILTKSVGAALASGLIVEVRKFQGPSTLDATAAATSTILTISQLLPPLSKSEVGTIRCVGLNYRKHAKEMNLDLPDHPTLFFKPSTCLGTPNAPLLIPHQATDGQADYEAELAVIIGKASKNVK